MSGAPAAPGGAVVATRGRMRFAQAWIELQAEDKLLQLKLPEAWVDKHPLTQADLEQERDYLKQLDIKLQVRAVEKLAAA